MAIDYKINQALSVHAFIDLLERSTLAKRRPVENKDCILGMLSNSNLLVTAWDKEKLVGVARSVTDFYYCCYLSDLAVDKDYQHTGIGKSLQINTQAQLKDTCKSILLAAPAAKDYYAKIGYSKHDSCWMLGSTQVIKS